MNDLIQPFGSKDLIAPLIDKKSERDFQKLEAESLSKMYLNESALSNIVMLGSGYFSPLKGFMNSSQVMSVCKNYSLPDGLFWPVPIMNLTKSSSGYKIGQNIALIDISRESELCIATMEIDDIEILSDKLIDEISLHVFGTNDLAHPGVKKFKGLGNHLISGNVQIFDLSAFPQRYPETFRTASQIREVITNSGWSRVVAFQTRNPMHRAHEELCRMAFERLDADGLIIHMLLGKLKEGDIPADIRDKCIKKMVDCYLSDIPVFVSGYGFDMLYAGPREALLHAIIRQNMGATHLIVGRDHAGVGDFYGAFEAQDIFDKLPNASQLKIKIFKADHTAFSKKLRKVVMMNEVHDHSPSDFTFLSGTRLRSMLENGQTPPGEVVRPEVADVLMKFYTDLKS